MKHQNPYMNIHGFNGQTMDIHLTGNTPHHACIFSWSPLLLSKSTAGFRQISYLKGSFHADMVTSRCLLDKLKHS